MNTIGVLGATNERSLRDRQLQNEFGNCGSKPVKEGFTKEGFTKESFMYEPRSQKDMAMLAKFNVCCNKSSPKEEYVGNYPGSAEYGHANYGEHPAWMPERPPPPRQPEPYEDPYNRSSRVMYVPLR